MQTITVEPNQELSKYKENQDITAPPDPVAEGTTSDVPIHGEATNILFYPTPTVTYKKTFDDLEVRTYGVCVGVLVAILFFGNLFGANMWGLLPLSSGIACGIFLWMQEVVQQGRRMEWSSEQLRGQVVSSPYSGLIYTYLEKTILTLSKSTANLLPESVEWLNSFVNVAWRLVNPDMLSPVSDTIEDIMQVSCPKGIENVRVAEIDQGSNPLRILSMRSLPDNQVQNLRENIHHENMMNKDPQERAVSEESGCYYNIEASFAYHALPSSQTASSKARNMHMQIVFYLGVRGLFGIPFPVFVELIEMVGTIRARCQLTPNPPFLKEATFSLVGLPHVKAGCTPMIRRGINILNLPIISNFVNYAIRTSCSIFAAPKSITMDLSMLLKGDDIHKETRTLGIMWIRIHRAVGLSKQDARGSEGGGSDPYINLSFSKYGKPMYCTRVITDDLNPIWEESTALLVTPELVKADENLSVELWDSDRNTADDIVGKVELPIREMLRHPSRMYPQVSSLQGMDKGSTMPGQLHWEVGYFGKPRLRPELRTDGKNWKLPEHFRNDPAFQDEKGTITNEVEDAVVHTPPDPLWPSGILHIVVHQIVNLQLANIKGSSGYRKGKEYEPAKSYGESKEEQSDDLPTSYCHIILNDHMVSVVPDECFAQNISLTLGFVLLCVQIYRTRAKLVTSQPIFNAGTERFVRNWQSSIVTISVRDQRYREHDPLLGVIPLKLSDVFQTSSQVTRWYPLDGGIGFGRARISLLLRHVDTKLPPSLLGWDVGTFEILSEKIRAEGLNHYAKIKLRTGGGTSKITRHVCHLKDGSAVYDLSDESYRQQLRLPVKYRYRSPVVFEFYLHGRLGTYAYSTLWLQHLTDNEETDIDVPIWMTKNGNRLVQNYVTERNWKSSEVHGLDDLAEVGRLKFRGRFSAGIDEAHEQLVVDNDSRETYETWEACVAEGVRKRQVSADIPERTRHLHQQSLIAAREMLKQADPEERRQWIDGENTGYSGAFGDDPRAYTDSKGRPVAIPGQESPRHDPVNPPRINGQPSREPNTNKADYKLEDSEEAETGESTTAEQRSLISTGHQVRPSTNSSMNGRGNENGSSSNGNDTSNASGSLRSSLSKKGKKSSRDINKVNRRSEKRQERGIMQWTPARNFVFARDEGLFALHKIRRKLPTGTLTGREPKIETETGL